VESLLEKWVYFIKHAEDLEVTPAHVTEPALEEAYHVAEQFAWTPDSLQHRFACHPFRRYQFGVWQQGSSVAGIVVYRPIRLAGLPAVALLAAYGADLPGLLRRWMGAVMANGFRLGHLVGTPTSATLSVLRETAVCLPQPFSRNPYYLTLKPLSPALPQTVFCFENWSCRGGDVL